MRPADRHGRQHLISSGSSTETVAYAAFTSPPNDKRVLLPLQVSSTRVEKPTRLEDAHPLVLVDPHTVTWLDAEGLYELGEVASCIAAHVGW